MSANEFAKKNISGMQVIKTLQLLLEDSYTMSELIEKLNKKEKEPIFNNNVVSKYINTCRHCGFEVIKIHNKYFLTKIPFGLEFSSREMELIEYLQIISEKNLNNKINNFFNSFINRLNKFSKRDLIKVEEKNIEKTFEVFEKAISEKRRIKLMLKTKFIVECIPLEVVMYKNKQCFSVFHKNKIRNISVQRVSGMEILGRKSPLEENSGETVVFKITGGLAYRYDLREHEKLVSKNLPEYIIVSNTGEEKEELLTRLLRYDKCCEILSPTSYREEIKKIIENMLANYGEE